MRLCLVGWHAWSKWGPVTAHNMVLKAQSVMGTVYELPAPIEHTEYRQERTCEACGLLQRREVST